MEKNTLSIADLWGILASTVCAVHCIASPIAIAFLPVYIGEAWESPLVHQLCAGAVSIFCLLAAYQGYRKHSDWKPLAPLALGLLFVIGATFFLPENIHEQLETPLLCFASSVLVVGHIWNIRRISDCCKHCKPSPAALEPTSSDS